MRRGETENREPEREARAEVIPGSEALDGALWQAYAPLREESDQGEQAARLRERLALVQQELVLRPPERPRFRLGWPRCALALAALGMVLAGGAAVAVTNFTNLGGPTNTLPAAPAPPTGNFHRIGVNLQQRGKPELLFLGTQVDGNSAAEAWPVVKALQQFGTLASVTPLVTLPCSMVTGTLSCTVPHAVAGYQVGDATFDLDHARYRSRYLVFVYRDLIGRNLRVQPLPPVERSLFDRYARASGYPRWNDAVWHTAVGYGSPGQFNEARQFPLVAAGRYLEAGPTLALEGDLVSSMMRPLPFGTVQQSLRRGRAVDGATQTMVPDFNAEANVLTAMICHADGGQPRNVCSRTVVKDILKHVR